MRRAPKWRHSTISALKTDKSDKIMGVRLFPPVYRKAVEELELLDIASEVSSKAEMASGKRRENVGKDPGCLSGKTVDYHS
jgi:hypothetical protein